jgi:hypothetical protein
MDAVIGNIQTLLDQASLPSVKAIELQGYEVRTVITKEVGVTLPTVEGDILVFEISPPVFTPPPPPPMKSTKAFATLRLTIQDPRERAATAYGVAAGVALHGSPWHAVSNDIYSSWQNLHAEHGIDWEVAKPHILTGWKAVGYLLQEDSEE